MDKEEKKRIEEQLEKARPLSISRVPIETRNKFIELAQKEFADDYGMTLKYLLDHFIDSQKYEQLAGIIEYAFGRISQLEDRVRKLEEKFENNDKNVLISNSGEGVKR